jgi:hypothetical protein
MSGIGGEICFCSLHMVSWSSDSCFWWPPCRVFGVGEPDSVTLITPFSWIGESAGTGFRGTGTESADERLISDGKNEDSRCSLDCRACFVVVVFFLSTAVEREVMSAGSELALGPAWLTGMSTTGLSVDGGSGGARAGAVIIAAAVVVVVVAVAAASGWYKGAPSNELATS